MVAMGMLALITACWCLAIIVRLCSAVPHSLAASSDVAAMVTLAATVIPEATLAFRSIGVVAMQPDAS